MLKPTAIVLSVLFLGIFPAEKAPRPAKGGGSEAITVNCVQQTGKLKGLHRQFSGGFEILAKTENLQPHLREVGAAMLRLPILREQPVFFKGKTLEDARNPRMYDFSVIDMAAARVQALGLELFATLAYMPPQLAADGTDKGPPKDVKVYAEVVQHVVLHLTQGWSNGYRYPIRYWEIWNEPDLSESPEVRQAYWTGTREQFFEMYAAVARAIKSIKPLPGQSEYKVGGPALAHLNNWHEPFLSFCAARKLPLDFFSFHHYDDDPRGFVAVIRKAHDSVRKHPRYRSTELILNEWNMAVEPWGDVKGKQGMELVFHVICNPKFAQSRGALHMARSLMLMERSPLSKANHFLLTDNGVSTMGVITCPEIPVPPKNPRSPPAASGPRLKFYVLKAFEMLNQTPHLVSVQIAGNQIDALAGTSADRNRVTVLLVNWRGKREMAVQTVSLPWAARQDASSKTSAWEQYVIDQASFKQGKAFQKVASGRGQGTKLTIALQMPAESVAVVRITPAKSTLDGRMGERMSRASQKKP